MIVIDWFHWAGMGDWQLNPACWPDPQGMVDELRSLGIELMITVWPFMGMPYDNGTATSMHWDEYAANGWLATAPTTTTTTQYTPHDVGRSGGGGGGSGGGGSSSSERTTGETVAAAAEGKGDDGDDAPWSVQSFWRYSTPTGNALVDATNPDGMARTFQHWFEGCVATRRPRRRSRSNCSVDAGPCFSWHCCLESPPGLRVVCVFVCASAAAAAAAPLLRASSSLSS
jgi:hypothetical protein